jgi:hypothetical protein
MALLYDDVAVVPLFHLNFFYGMAKNLVWEPRVDGVMNWWEMKYAE